MQCEKHLNFEDLVISALRGIIIFITFDNNYHTNYRLFNKDYNVNLKLGCRCPSLSVSACNSLSSRSPLSRFLFSQPK
jgi:hypothetical protein